MLNIPEEIKDLLHEDTCQKNIRIHFPNGERSDICNDLIVKDSLSITESLCSQEGLRFGLCEAPIFECEVVGVGNIKGANIEVSCEIYCPMSVTGAVYKPDIQAYIYSIPLGSFLVSECQKQADMAHRRIIAYNNLTFSLEGLNKNGKQKFNYPSSTNMPLEQNLAALVTEILQDNVFNCPLTPVVTTLTSETFSNGSTGSTTIYYFVSYTMSAAASENVFFFDVPEGYNGAIEYVRLYNGTDGGHPFQRMINPYKPYSPGAVPQIGGGRGFYNIVDQYIYPYMSLSSNETNTFFTTNTSATYGPVILQALYKKEETDRHGVTTTTIYCNSSELRLYTLSLPYDYGLYWARTLTENNKYIVADVDSLDIKEIAAAYFETMGLFCSVDRNNNIKVLNIKRNFGLPPNISIKPNTDLYPQGVTGGKLLPEDYQSCWYDDEYTKFYGAVYCEYKNTSNETIQFTYYLPGFTENTDEDTYLVYDLTNNDIIRGATWTQAEIQGICLNIANNISGVQYMPVDFVGRGLPYVEAGDTFEILTKSNDSITTIVLNRTLTGEQYMVDSYKSVNT